LHLQQIFIFIFATKRHIKSQVNLFIYGDKTALGLPAANQTLITFLTSSISVRSRGTATAFVIVATVFLGTTMLGWRGLMARRSTAK
jgi:hypothetical protein